MIDTAGILARLPDQTPDILIQCGLVECGYLWFTASFEEYLKTVKRTVDVARESGLHHRDNEPNGLGVSAGMGLSHYSEARDLLQKMNMTLYLRTRHDTAQYHFQSASCEMARGDAASALEYADTARRTIVASGANLDQALTDAGLAQICSECGQAGIAAAHLESALELASITGSSHSAST